MIDLFVSMNSEDEIYDLAEIDSDVVIGNLLGDIKKLQAENAELKVLNSTQENLLKASINWMDSKGCPVPYDFRVAFETPPEGG